MITANFGKKNVLQLFKISDNYSSNMIIENFVIDSQEKQSIYV